MSYLKIPENVLNILNTLEENGYEAYVVGGCVRDYILNISPNDWDICTSAKPDEVENCFKDKRIIETGIKHGTVTVAFNNSQYEITTYRVDGNYTDGRHPDSVSFTSSIIDDLSRRDLTQNAIAFNPKHGFVDDFNGIEDIKNGIIRCVGNSKERFQEDGLRILRALRFASVYNFKIDKETSDAIHECRHLLKNVSTERINSEFCKLLTGMSPVRILREYSDVISEFIPEINKCIGFDQNSRWHCYDVWEHTLHALSVSDQDLIIRLSLFFHDIGKPDVYTIDEDGYGHFHNHGVKSRDICESVMKRMKFDNETISAVCELVQYHDIRLEVSKSAMRKFLNKHNEEQAFRLFNIRKCDIFAQSGFNREPRLEKIRNLERLCNEIIRNKDCIFLKDLNIKGGDIISLGIEKGPEVGNILDSLLNAVIENKVENKKEDLIQYAQTHIINKSIDETIDEIKEYLSNQRQTYINEHPDIVALDAKGELIKDDMGR